MADIHPYRPNALAGSPLDRVGERRIDDAWIASALAAPDTLYVPVWRGRSLMRPGPAGAAEAVLLGQADVSRERSDKWAFLGLLSGRTVFALDLSGLDDPLGGSHEGKFEDLRRVGGSVAPHDAALMAHARGLMHWRTRSSFCGVCGAACIPASAGHVMRCQGCGTHHFPRTDPAVIMLVTHGNHCLLGQPQMFKDMRVFTTLAGFVEPGESLEEAVAREVFEEAGIKCANARYHSSQPWPFPGNIMLGFYAEGLTEDITIDPTELKDARWFSRQDIHDRESLGFDLPRVDSIARRLIEDWLAAA